MLSFVALASVAYQYTWPVPNPLRAFFQNETDCTPSDISYGGRLYEEGYWSVCVTSQPVCTEDLLLSDPQHQCECDAEQLFTYPYGCMAYQGLNLAIGPSDWMNDNGTNILSSTVLGIPIVVPRMPTSIQYIDITTFTPPDGFKFELIPSPPNTARLRFASGFPDLVNQGVPTFHSNGHKYNWYSVMALLTNEVAEHLATSPTSGAEAYIAQRYANYEGGMHTTWFQTRMGGYGGKNYGLNATQTSHRVRADGIHYPDNVITEDIRPLELGDEFELNPGVDADFLAPYHYKRPYTSDTFRTPAFLNTSSPPGDGVLGMSISITSDLAGVNGLFMLQVHVCEDGIVVHKGEMCCDELKRQHTEKQCCANADTDECKDLTLQHVTRCCWD